MEEINISKRERISKRGVAMERSRMLGVLFADKSNNGLTHAYFSGVLNSFKVQAEEKGYDIAFLNCNKSGENRMSYAEQIRYRNYDGIIIACIDFGDDEVKELMEMDVPVVVIDEDMDGVACVISDNVEGLKAMVDYLIELGHKRIAYITGDDNTVTRARLEGFYEECGKHGIEIPDEYVKHSNYRDMRKASFFTEELMRLPEPPSCIIYSDDYAAIGGMNILHARGVEIPDEVSVTGYDGLDILAQCEPRLTTVKQDTEGIGRTAANKLIELIEHPDTAQKDKTVVPTALEKGKTAGRVYY